MRSAQEVMTCLQVWTKEAIPVSQSLPTNRKYNPSMQDVRNHMYIALNERFAYLLIFAYLQGACLVTKIKNEQCMLFLHHFILPCIRRKLNVNYITIISLSINEFSYSEHKNYIG